MKCVLFFIDGLGLGSANTDENPLINNMPFFRKNFGKNCFINTGFDKTSANGFVKSIDASLKTEGLPQSATGQTSLFTGINAAKVLGYHLTATPNEALKTIIYEHSILKQLKVLGYKVTGANAYSEEYLKEVEACLAPLSASSYAILAAPENFRLLPDLKAGKAVFMDITNEELIKRGYKLKKITPKKAGENLFNLTNEYDFTLYEYFLTDFYGHGRGTINDVKRILKDIDSFTENFVSLMGNDMLLIITSDHGNIENILKKPHTENPVPFIVFCKNNEIKEFLYNNVDAIENVTPAIVYLFTH